MRKGIVTFWAAMALCAAPSYAVVDYSIEPLKIYPAEGQTVSSLDRVQIRLDRGFGPVGYDHGAEGMKVYIENEAGERVMLVNAVNAAPAIAPEWGLAEMDGSTHKDVYTYKDKLYNDLFTRTLGWNGGDGVFTVGLPGGHVYWTFNDSFYGVADAATRARGACSFPRNTIMAQCADDEGYPVGEDESLLWLARFNQTTDPGAAGYYKAFTHIDHPEAASFNDDGIAQDFLYWSGDGTLADGKLQMLWNGVDNRNGQMIALGTALATYSLEGRPGDADYLKLESVDHDFLPYNPYAYGSTLWEDPDGHIYLYSSTGNGNWLGNDPIVARTVGSDLAGEWEYYIRNASGNMQWQKEYPTKAQVEKSGIAPGEGSYTLPWVFKKGNLYYMCAQTFPFGQEMNIMCSEHPWGPFKNHKTLIKFPNPLDELQHDMYGDKYRFLYMLNLHPALSRNGELVISTNTDATDDGPGSFWRNFNNPGSCDWYRPFFFRVFHWEQLFADKSMLGESDIIEFMPEGSGALTEPGKYKFVCEQGVFGNEGYEASGYADGLANKRIEVRFTLGEGASVYAVDATGSYMSSPVYYNMQGIRVSNPVPGEIYIVRRGDKVEKAVMP
jgi:hypothetical protein